MGPLTAEQVVVMAGIITAVVGAGIRRAWVWGWTYTEMRDDRDFWRKTALTAMGHTDRAIDVVDKVAGGAIGEVDAR
jgi:hypothetical protein